MFLLSLFDTSPGALVLVFGRQTVPVPSGLVSEPAAGLVGDAGWAAKERLLMRDACPLPLAVHWFVSAGG